MVNRPSKFFVFTYAWVLSRLLRNSYITPIDLQIASSNHDRHAFIECKREKNIYGSSARSSSQPKSLRTLRLHQTWAHSKEQPVDAVRYAGGGRCWSPLVLGRLGAVSPAAKAGNSAPSKLSVIMMGSVAWRCSADHSDYSCGRCKLDQRTLLASRRYLLSQQTVGGR